MPVLLVGVSGAADSHLNRTDCLRGSWLLRFSEGSIPPGSTIHDNLRQ